MDYYRDSVRSPNDRIRPRDDYSRDRVRSPIHERGHRSRRSRSPGGAVDRYEPRGRRDDYMPRDRERGDRDDRNSRRMISPPTNIDRYVPGHDPVNGAGLTVNPVPDPAKMSYQVGFSYFSEWWRFNEKIKEEKERQRTGRRREPERNKGARETQEEREREKVKIQAAYDSYKEELQAKMARQFVAEHKKEQWFKERYDPPTRDEFRSALGEFRRGAYAQWEQDMDAGVFDRFSLEGLNKGDQVGNGANQEKEEGEATASNELLGVGDLVPGPGADIRDENLYQPTLLIKTIAPHVSRQNLENFCKEHLGEGEGGFKWLSLSDPNPSKKYHRIGWVMLHPAPEAVTTIDRADPRDEDDDMDDIKHAAPVQSTAEKALEAINSKTVKDEVRGDFVCHVGVHNPPSSPRKKALWDLFSSEERIRKDLSLVHRLANKFEEDFGVEFSGIARVQEKVQDLREAGLLKPANASRRSRKPAHDTDLDVEDDDMHDDDGEIDEDELNGTEESEDFIAQKKELDLLIEYLRRVFNFCFFCVFESDSVHELTRKCPGGHLRRPRVTLSDEAKEVAIATVTGDPFPVKKKAEPMEEGEAEPSDGDKKFRSATNKAEQQLLRAYNWVKTFEDKIMQILEPDSVDLKKLGGRPLEEAMDDEMRKFVKQEDEHKWRCKIPDCTKLFKEEHFWKKHVEKRHTDWYEALRHEFTLINAYAIDPSHIAPSRTDANSNGHFPPPNNHTTAGTPRGFSLQNMSMGGINGGGAPGFGMGHNISGMGMHSWDGRDGSGPVRRNGNRNNNNRSGPYDRRQNGGRWDNSGRNNKNAGGRWGDGGSGGSTVGPREAVQGRSLKSYEDLDQVGNGGGGGGELNY
ncbi:hypothetical protein TD95_004554 [Thielaviopsis punctulata]|uniref:C2H2-type domain-containing protein n=1 Tax=Thielaviopsis punctulata TaxID=72032 RepID=A0A0F4ZDU3_9PEZI|nr:hypothetical protein TD95_004554 [Thielaviopsis punctulata]